MTRRPSWDEVWMGVADTIAERSDCEGRQVGAVLVDSNNRIVSSGYNGPPASFYRPAGTSCGMWCARQQQREDDSDKPAMTYGLGCPTVHAEANALIFADRRNYAGGTIYVTAACCADCAKLIANSGVSRVVVRVDDRDLHRDPQSTLEFLAACGIAITIWSKERGQQ